MITQTTRPMTKSPRAVARAAYGLAKEALPAYSSKFSKTDFTQHCVPMHAKTGLLHCRRKLRRVVAGADADCDGCEEMAAGVADHGQLGPGTSRLILAGAREVVA